MSKASDAIPSSYKPWLIVSILILVGSLVLVSATVIAAFVSFGDTTTPLWITVLGVFAVLGVMLGFGGFFLLMATAAYQNWRESRRVQIIPPEHRGS